MPLDFQYIYRDQKYDRLNNPERRSVEELAPIGIEWDYQGIDHKYLFKERGKAVSLKKAELIAIVESGGGSSRSIIIDHDGKNCLTIDNGREGEDFFDVYYVHDEINIFSNYKNVDYVTVFDEDTMSVRYKKEHPRY